MLERLESIRKRYEELNELLSDPEVINRADLLRKYSKEQSDLEPKYRVYCEYKDVSAQYDDARTMLTEESDPDMIDMVKAELEELSERKQVLEEKIQQLQAQKAALARGILDGHEKEGWRLAEEDIDALFAPLPRLG